MNIDRIEIESNNYYLNIYPKNKELVIDNKRFSIEEDKIKDLIRIIRTWNDEYLGPKYFDGPHFCIKIYSQNGVNVIRGNRHLPDNYYEFEAFIRSLYDRG